MSIFSYKNKTSPHELHGHEWPWKSVVNRARNLSTVGKKGQRKAGLRSGAPGQKFLRDVERLTKNQLSRGSVEFLLKS